MANETKITEIVGREAYEQLEKLTALLETTKNKYIEAAKEMAKLTTVKPTNYEELDAKMKSYDETSRKLVATQNELARLSREQITVINRLSSALPPLTKSIEAFLSHTKEATNALGANTKAANENATAAQNNAQSSREAASGMETASEAINLSAKAYNDIIKSITAYNSNLESTNKSLVDNKVRITEIRNNLKDLDDQYKRHIINKKEYKNATAALLSEERLLMEQGKKYVSELRTHAQVAVSTTGSYYKMNAAVLALEKRYKSLSQTQRESPLGTGMVKQIDDLKGKLKTIDASLGNYQRNVGNYASSWNGLQYQFQMISRELPNLGINLQTFIISLSNNIPYLVDELQKASVAHKQYVAAVKAGNKDLKAVPSVFKQAIGAIFNWQTAIIVAITLITSYRKEIQDWIGSLFGAWKSINNLQLAEEQLNEVRRNGMINSIKERTELKILYEVATDVSRSSDQRRAAIEKLQEKYPSYLGNLSEEDFLSGKAADSYERLKSKIIETAKAKGAFDAIAENQKEILKIQHELEDTKVSGGFLGWLDKHVPSLSQNMYVLGLRALLFKQKVSSAINEETKLENANKKLEDFIKSLDLDYNYDEDGGKEHMDRLKYMQKLQIEINSATAKAMDEQRESELAEVEAWYQRRLSIIRQGGKKTQEEIEKENELRVVLEQAKAQKIKDINERFDSEIAKANIENRLASIKVTNEYELAERTSLLLQQNEILRIAEVKEAEKTGKSVADVNRKYARLNLDILNDAANERIRFINEKSEERRSALETDELKELNANQKAYNERLISEEEFQRNKVDIQRKYNRLALEAQMDAILKILLNEKNLTEKQITEYRNLLKKLKAEIDEIDLTPDPSKLEIWLNKNKKYIDKALELWNQLGELGNNILQGRIENIEAEQEANEEAGEKELERIEELANSGAISEEEAERRKRIAKEKTKEKDKELEKQKAELQIRQARLQKAIDIGSIIMNTAVGIMAALAKANIPLSILIGAIGAAQLATVIAQPIPKYAKGTDNHPGGLAVVGDGGKREAVLFDGSMFITPSIPTLIELPKGATVLPEIPRVDDMDYLARVYRSDLRMAELDNQMNGRPDIINNVVYLDGLDKKMDTLISSNNASAKEFKKLCREIAKNNYIKARGL